MIELFNPEEPIALVAWYHRAWGMEFPVSGDTLAMHPNKAVTA